MGFYKDYLMEKTVDELKEYRRKRIKDNIKVLFVTAIAYFIIGCTIGVEYVETYGIDYASDIAVMFFSGAVFCEILNILANTLALDRAIRERERKDMESFYAGVTE